MTTSQHVLPADPSEIARFDDDGGVPAQYPAAAAAALRPDSADAPPRLSLSPVRGQDSFDGAWWPRTMRLADELPGLLTVLAQADGNIRRVSVNGDAWAAIPDLAGGSGLPRARVDWFRTLDPRVITAGGGSNLGRPRLRLLVIPPEAAPGPAETVLRAATAGGLTGSAGEILRQAGAETPAGDGGPTGATAPESSTAPAASP
ncbi:DUF5994 family protein [Frankia gtarii]|uniref:DUF5994 family protein n=1 Tax=Frankia gtarii TaxID=2950102 RepID=UPI0021C065D5|nr:DUF5994 family protein [Frankia gtarii]